MKGWELGSWQRTWSNGTRPKTFLNRTTRKNPETGNGTHVTTEGKRQRHGDKKTWGGIESEPVREGSRKGQVKEKVCWYRRDHKLRNQKGLCTLPEKPGNQFLLKVEEKKLGKKENRRKKPHKKKKQKAE